MKVFRFQTTWHDDTTQQPKKTKKKKSKSRNLKLASRKYVESKGKNKRWNKGTIEPAQEGGIAGILSYLEAGDE